MGSIFRSEEMALCQLFIQPEAAYSSVSVLGEKGTVQFRDLNENVNSFQRKFVAEVRRCDEMERKLRYIEVEVNKDGVKIPDCDVIPKAPNPREIIDLEAHLEKMEGEILELSQNAVNLRSNYLELTELKHVLEKTQVFFTEQEEASESLTKSLITEDNVVTQIHRGRLGFVAGVVQRERVPAFERMLWRISRGNVFLRQNSIESPLEDPSTGNKIYKTVFAAFFQGEELKSRVQKVCAGFHASLYPCPNLHSERVEMLKGVRTRLEDLNLVLNQTQDHRQRVLVTVAKQLPTWSIMVKKMKAIYHTLNMFNMDVTKKCLIGECWVPIADIGGVRSALVEGGKAGGSSIPSFLNIIDTLEDPPTFNRTNKFTRGFQNLIDAYGVSTYREANPALYTIITFPFLFAVMFGDLGHGLIMFLFALTMVLMEKRIIKSKLHNEVFNIFFAGRYIVLLMGLFSMYTGLIYNDLFSKSVNIFGSSWRINMNATYIVQNKDLSLDPAPAADQGSEKDAFAQYPYPLGLDPVWQVATSNKIIFLNSFKMKISIIIGVLHMVFGVCMSVVNYVHFKRYSSIFLEFIPQILFLLLLFCYLAVMMIMKWIMYSANYEPVEYSAACAPSVLILFINMMLQSSQTPAPRCNEMMFEGQRSLHKVFVILAIVCIPVMLFGRPIYLVMASRKKKRTYRESNGDVTQGLELREDIQEVNITPEAEKPEAHHEETFGEIMIEQAIHTIEYVLSTISHTASYLRLWALSLAHAQLSDVLWSMVLRQGLTSETYVGCIILFFAFAFWAALTLAILVMMEGLSAFLHTLRLHWVEFMSKFFKGEGYAFIPFSFKTILEEEEEED